MSMAVPPLEKNDAFPLPTGDQVTTELKLAMDGVWKRWTTAIWIPDVEMPLMRTKCTTRLFLSALRRQALSTALAHIFRRKICGRRRLANMQI